jgi:hypothetical protein
MSDIDNLHKQMKQRMAVCADQQVWMYNIQRQRERDGIV